MRRNDFMVIGMIMLSSLRVVAQDEMVVKVPQIGQKIYDFRFGDVKYFNRKSVSVSDFKGKFLILDFFTTGCASCFESLPKVNQLAAEFKDRVQIMMVGLDERNLRSIYERYRLKNDYTLPVAYLNREEWTKFEISGVPHIIIVDPKGVVKAITHTFNKTDLELFLGGKDAHILPKFSPDDLDNMEKKYTWRVPLLVNENGASDSSIVFRSMLTKWSGTILSSFSSECMIDMNSSMGSGGDPRSSRFEAIGYDLKRLYRIAYGDTLSHSYGPNENVYGKMWPHLILELRDSSDFISSSNTAINKYNYSLIVPKRNNNLIFMQQVMQNDLLAYFGHNASVEERLMPCWNLVATEKAKKKLQSTGRKFSKMPSDRTDIMIVNKPLNSLVEQLYFAFPKENPIIDQTGISGNIDVYIEGLKSDLQDIRKGLQKNGLDLVKSQKLMKVVVIRDPKPEPSSK